MNNELERSLEFRFLKAMEGYRKMNNKKYTY
jgi:hypothetical protein